MKTFKEIQDDCFYKMANYHQVTIDLIEKTDELFSMVADAKTLKSKKNLTESMGALSYEISITLEIFNPTFEIEISDLKDVLRHIEKEIEKLKQ